MAGYASNECVVYERLKKNNLERDARMRAMSLVRTGKANMVFQGLFPSDWPQPIIANFIDVVAKDTAEMVGVLPTLSAPGDSPLDESKRSKSDKKSRIINYHAYASNLGTELVTAADRMSTYGFVALRVEPNYTESRPHIHVDDSLGTYYEKDRFGRLVTYLKVTHRKASDLAALFPEHANKLMQGVEWGGDRNLELVTYYTDDSVMLFVPYYDGLTLAHYANPISRIPVSIAELPSLDGEARGQFDDVLWVFAAKARLALFSLEATQKAVEAPLAVPADVQEFAFGPDAIIRTQNPQAIRRVPLELPQSAMIENRVLDEEMRFGARFPEARAGQSDASIVTGRGVQALMGGFDSRIKVAQSMLGNAISEATSICLEMDEAIWGDMEKEVFASVNGSTYTLKYRPSRDIKGDYSVAHEYGVMAGLDPNRALVWGLQALGAGLVSKSFVMSNLPVNLNVTEEVKVIDVERLRDAALMSLQSYAQTLPELAAQGQDPTQVIQRISKVIDARKKGTPIEKALEDAFAPDSPAPSQEDPAAVMAQEQGMGMPPGGGPTPGGPPRGTPQGLQQLLATMGNNGQPIMTARTMRQAQIA